MGPANPASRPVQHRMRDPAELDVTGRSLSTAYVRAINGSRSIR